MKTLSIVIFLLSFSSVGQAQDSMRIINGKVITGSIKNVTPYEIKYYSRGKNPSMSGNAGYRRLSTSEVSEIVYADGRRDSVLSFLKNIHDTSNRHFREDFYRLGENDAKLYFRKYKGATTGTFLATFPGSPVLGLMVATFATAKKPSPKHFTYPNPALLASADYKEGYAHKAHQIKVGKVWTSWGIGCLLTFATVMILSTGGN